jgi:hypothetical protein
VIGPKALSSITTFSRDDGAVMETR